MTTIAADWARIYDGDNGARLRWDKEDAGGDDSIRAAPVGR